MAPTSQDSTLAQLIQKLNRAAETFGLKLPAPARSTRKKSLTVDQVSKKTQLDNSSRVQPQKSNVYDFNSSAKESYRLFVIRDRWAMLEREVKSRDPDQPLPLVRMPLITRKEVENHLQEMFGREKSRNLTVLVTEESIHLCQHEIGVFVTEVERTRIIAVNIKDPQHGHGVDGEQGPVQIALAAFSGLVLKFSNPQLLPNRLKSFLSDVGYAKLGVSPDREGSLLQQVGIRLRGWIHSGAVFRALLAGNEAEFDVDDQIKFLESEGFVKSPRQELTSPERLDGQVENAWVPMAVTMAAALNFASKRGYPNDKQMFPIIWEAVDLVRDKVAEDLLHLSSNPIENWIPAVSNCPSSDHQKVNSFRAIVRYRMMLADFVEVFDPAFDPSEAARIPSGLFVDAQTKKFPLPSAVPPIDKGQISFEGLCLFCGGQGIQDHQCPQQGHAEAACVYPHDNVPDLPPHSTRFCPVLHFICNLCNTRGHYPEAHANREFSQREFRERFFKFAHLGLYTSVPYLFLIPKIFEILPLTRHHWRAGYRCCLFQSDLITRYHLGIDVQRCLEISANLWAHQDLGRRQLALLKVEHYQRNAEAESLEDFRIVPRSIKGLKKVNPQP